MQDWQLEYECQLHGIFNDSTIATGIQNSGIFEQTKLSNIYDMVGNLRKYSQEMFAGNKGAMCGYGFEYSGYDEGAGYASSPNEGPNYYTGFRPALYIK